MSAGSPGAGGPSPTDRRGWWAGLLLLVASIQFVLGMAITQLGWTTPYSLSQNYISDLGAAHCEQIGGIDPRYVCSPWHLVFDTSIVILGLLTIAAVVLLWRVFGPGALSAVGLILLALSGVGAMGVGFSPEDVNLTVHQLSALIAFACGNTALILLGAVLWRHVRFGAGYGVFSVLLGLVGWFALLMFLTHHFWPLGVGGYERLTVAPTLLWAAVVGAKLLVHPREGPGRVSGPAPG